MKLTKLFALFLVLTVVFTLVACSNGNNDDSLRSQQGTDAPLTRDEDTSIDVGSIMNGNGSTDTIYGQLDESSKQQIISDFESEGYKVTFGADGSMTIVDPEGNTIKQNPDGTWVIKDEDGGEGQLGGNWPDNEFTKLVPKPDFELSAANAEINKFSVAFTSVTIEQMKDYVAKVKAAGFNIKENVQEQKIGNMVIYSFTAENTDGYTISITSANGTNTLVISK